MVFNSKRFNPPPWPIYTSKEKDNLIDSLESGFWAGSRAGYIKKAKESFLNLQSAKNGFLLSNGTVTLESALMALKIGSGDEVIVPALTFYSTASAVLRVNATPVIVDVCKKSFCISKEAIEKNITSKTKAIIVVHLAGAMCKMDEILKIARRENLKVIEDCAHAHGSHWKNKGAGTMGDFGSFSFQHSKLITTGEGGFLIGKSPRHLEAAWNYSNCGRPHKSSVYEHSMIGTNNRMSDFQAAILESQIARYHKQLIKREKNVNWIKRKMGNIPGVTLQEYHPEMTKKAYYNFIMVIDPKVYGTKKVAKVFAALNQHHVPTSLPYPPLGELDIFKKSLETNLKTVAMVKISDCSNAKYISNNSIWIHHKLLLADKATLQEFLKLFISILNK